MKLREALDLVAQPVSSEAPVFSVFLACGFTPLHLGTFLDANLRVALPRHAPQIGFGLFGDLIGNIERLDATSVDSLVAVTEWADLDARLGFRSLGGWRAATLPDIVESAEHSAERLQRSLLQVSKLVPTVVSLPTLPLPPLFFTPPHRADSFELRLRLTVASLAASLSEQPNIRVVSAQRLDEASPSNLRYDVRSDVNAGFPYSIQHASALAGLLARLIENRPPKKGLITDLDDTLWAGILGEEGVDGVSWNLEHHTQMHGVYQQFVGSLSAAGVLISVASKNDLALVEQAFERSDLLISKGEIFPIEAHWSRKSESVKRILDTWNVGADSVVFVDDSPMEVAEVKAAFPEMECIVFPKSDYQGVLNLLKQLRERFGKSVLTEDDALRLSSIRRTSEWRRDSRESGENSSDDLLSLAQGSIAFGLARETADTRAFELVNKTNQFNLNGRRFSEAEWRKFLSDPTAFILSVSYKDKYGPLGTIAVALGKIQGSTVSVPAWVMSCRAFSRRIEFHCLQYMFEKFAASEIVFELQPTARNGPLVEFFQRLVDGPIEPNLRLSKSAFLSKAPKMPHLTEEVSIS